MISFFYDFFFYFQWFPEFLNFHISIFSIFLNFLFVFIFFILYLGLEPIIFDISDPTFLANIVYRIKQIRTDLDRTFFGTIVNIAGMYVRIYNILYMITYVRINLLVYVFDFL